MKNATEVKKELYKSKVDATLNRVESGKMYYNVKLEDGTYQFPIEILEQENTTLYRLEAKTQASPNVGLSYVQTGDKYYTLAVNEFGNTAFTLEMKASSLNRWIAKAIEKDEFVKVG